MHLCIYWFRFSFVGQIDRYLQERHIFGLCGEFTLFRITYIVRRDSFVCMLLRFFDKELCSSRMPAEDHRKWRIFIDLLTFKCLSRSIDGLLENVNIRLPYHVSILELHNEYEIRLIRAGTFPSYNYSNVAKLLFAHRVFASLISKAIKYLRISQMPRVVAEVVKV